MLGKEKYICILLTTLSIFFFTVSYGVLACLYKTPYTFSVEIIQFLPIELARAQPISHSFFVDIGKRLRISFVLWAEAFSPRFADKVIATPSAVVNGLLEKIGLNR